MNEERTPEYFYRNLVFQVDEEVKEGGGPSGGGDGDDSDEDGSMNPQSSMFVYPSHGWTHRRLVGHKVATVMSDDGTDCASVSSYRSVLKPRSQQRYGSGPTLTTTATTTSTTASTSCSHSVISTRSEVSFDSVGIWEFPITLGDNPAALGPPVQLDYTKKERAQIIKLESYEQERKQRRRRSMHQLRMTTRQRHVILREELSQEEINQAVLHAKQVRLQRLQTQSQSWVEQRWDEATESVHRKFTRCMPCAC
eukprot:scaffold265_cov131-Cylindrotheca_fusiformis.AAC.2